MSFDELTFAGVEFSSGRKPVTFVALDNDLSVLSVQKWELSEALACLRDYENLRVAISPAARQQETYTDFKKKLGQAGFRLHSTHGDQKQFLVTDAQDCFRALSGHNLLPRRSLEGRLQRTAILYDQGLQVVDPVDVFEEITRYKLIQGILPLENIYSSKELDALVAAYLAWMAVNRPGKIVVTGELALPAGE